MHGDNQPISITTYDKSTLVRDAYCTISNDENTWYVNSPGSVTVTRSAEALTVHCDKEGFDPGLVTVESSVKAMAFGNLIFGGIVGAAIDAGTGAAFDYPASIRVQMGEENVIYVEPKEGEGS